MLVACRTERVTPLLLLQDVGARDQFELHKRRQLFIRMHNEALSVAAMCICHKGCPPARIRG
jgi:hypothetical protein